MDDLAHGWRALSSATRRRLLATTEDVDVVFVDTAVGWTTVRPAEGFRARGTVSARGEGRIYVTLREPLLVRAMTEALPYGLQEFMSGGLGNRYVGRHDLICVPADWGLAAPRCLHHGPWYIGLPPHYMTDEELLVAIDACGRPYDDWLERLGEGSNNPTKGRRRRNDAQARLEALTWEASRRGLRRDPS